MKWNIYILLIIFPLWGWSESQTNHKDKQNDFDKILKQKKKKYGINSITYLQSLMDYANSNYNSENYAKALELYSKALELSSILEGVQSSSYGLKLNYIADTYYKLGYTKKSLYYYKLLFEIDEYKSRYAEGYFYALLFYSHLIILDKQYDALHKTKNEIINLSHALNYTKNKDYLISISNISQCYNDLGKMYYNNNNIDSATYYYLLAKDLSIKNKENAPYEYLNRNNNLLVHYMNIGDNVNEYKIADALFIDTSILFKQKKDFQFIIFNNIALAYKDNKQYIVADYIYSIIKNRNLTISDTLKALYLANNALLKKQMGDYLEAEKMYKQSLDIKKKLYGYFSETYATSLSNLGVLYSTINNNELREQCYREALQIRETIYNSDNPNLGESYMNLGVLLLDKNQIDSSKYFYLKAYDIFSKFHNEQFPNIIQNMAHIYAILGKFDSAQFYMKFRMTFLLNDISQYASYTDLSNFDFIIHKNEYLLDLASSYAFKSHFDGSLFASDLLDYNLIFKNLTLRTWVSKLKKIRRINDTTLNQLYLHYQTSKDIEIKTLLNNNDTSSSLLNTNSSKQTERIINLNLNNSLFDSTDQIKIRWQDIQSKLKNKDAAIDFISFNYYDNGRWTDSIFYCAFVMREDSKNPIFIYLFEQKQLDGLLENKVSKKGPLYYNDLMSYNGKGTDLYNLIWKPLDKALAGISSVYLSLTGSLYTINISSLPSGKYTKISDKYSIQTLGSIVELTNINDLIINNNNELFVYGGIDYDAEEIQDKSKQANIQYTNSGLDSDTITKRVKYSVWKYLPGTFNEGAAIKELGKTAGIPVEYINGIDATETSIKQLSRANIPYILHLSTHAYFFSNIKEQREDNIYFESIENIKNIFKQSENPLFRTGLIFAGANKTWSNYEYNNDNKDDGILTAYEISNLDLSNCQLVVLSACETGLGDINGSQGVYGLQRAFKMAGVKNIIMSLWKVPDQQTNELMQYFYQNLFSGFTISKSLKKAQQKMAEKYSPYFWAAFVLLE